MRARRRPPEGRFLSKRVRANRRLVNFAGFAVCAALLAYALYSQFYLGLDPCPLCIFQRIGVALLGVVFLAAALHNPRGRGAFVIQVGCEAEALPACQVTSDDRRAEAPRARRLGQVLAEPSVHADARLGAERPIRHVARERVAKVQQLALSIAQASGHDADDGFLRGKEYSRGTLAVIGVALTRAPRDARSRSGVREQELGSWCGRIRALRSR